MRIKNIFAFILFFLTACDITKTIDYDIDYSPDKIVITGFIGSGNRAEVYISTSHQPLSQATDSVFDAEVSLFEDGEYVGNLTGTGPLFVTEAFTPKPGKSYSVKASMNGYPDAFSEPEIIPSPVQLDSVKYILNSEREIYLSTYFKDPLGKNYYDLKYILSYNDTLFNKDRLQTPLINTTVFDDKLFENTEFRHERQLSLSAGRYNNKNIQFNTIYVVLFSVTQSGYKYYKSLNEADYTNGDMYTIPSVIHSNINEGYGVFAAYSTDTIKIKLKL